MATAERTKRAVERRAKFLATGAASAIIWAPVFGFQFIMLWLITLKEDKGFWLNSSGYEIGFRDFVQYSYYPLLMLDSAFVLGGTVIGGFLFSKYPLSGIFAFCWLPLIWIMLGVVYYINIGDNIAEYARSDSLFSR